MTEKISKSEEQWRQELTEEEYEICRNKGTERAFTGEYYDTKDIGTYHCRCCGEPLFSSEAKYDSGSGWPSFYAPLANDIIREQVDHSLVRERIEITCDHCGAHLGHVFPDGPQPTGLRYCVNSASLKLHKAD